MKKYYVDLKGDWAIVFAYDIEMLDLDKIVDWLEELDADDEDIRKACETIMKWNTGFTYNNEKLRMSLVCIGRSTSVEEYMNTLSHEIDHVQEAVCSYYDIPLGTERAAYLQGDIMAGLIHEIRVNK